MKNADFIQASITHLPFKDGSFGAEIFPLTFWLIINNILGLIRKGYWIILKYKNPEMINGTILF